MILDVLVERPTKQTTKYLLNFSVLLIVIAVPLVIIPLELSNFAGTLDETQLGFNGDYIKSMFSLMSNEEILMFFLGNLFDYVFIVGYGSFIFSTALSLTRKLKIGSLWNKIGFLIAIFGIISAICDGIENIFLFLMVLNPTNFPTWLGIPHSSFALMKFLLMYLTMGWIILTAFFLLISKLIKRNSLNKFEVSD
ncbi:MAG: hypothetical protein ACFE95_01670 [Candidatus Hodarchaeota archaeon]